ncbi:MAG: SH3 domain-containing protein [Chloroflexaceae bacterium]|nr:SH3 domain-containing protein [Chloroflexaceae bacterium]
MLFVLLVGTLASAGCAALAPPPASSGGGGPPSVSIGSAANGPDVLDLNDPRLTITKADLVNPTTLSIVAQAEAIPDGTQLQLELLAADQPTAWLAADARTVQVADGSITVRATRHADAVALDCTQPLAIRLSGQVNGTNLDPTYALTIPSIYQAEVCLPPQAILIAVGNGGNLREAPSGEAPIIGQIALGQEVAVLGRWEDGGWYLLRTSAGQEGWTAHAALSPPEAQVALLPVLAAPNRTAASRPADPPPAPAAPAPIPAQIDGIPTIAAAELPPEARETMRLIARGGPFPYSKDGTIFQNRERLLPLQPAGYYREYTVRTPGASNRGARRIVGGSANELYYTDDHYASFRRIVE